jgi:uncharacterized membrane protein YqjE
MQGDGEEPLPPDENGPVSGLFRSISNLFATLLGMARTRIELLTTELQSEVRYSAEIIVWTLVTMLAACMGIFATGLVVVVVLWDTHRLIASVSVIAFFFAIAAIAALVLRAKVRGKPRLLEATLAELAKDREQLERRQRG